MKRFSRGLSWAKTSYFWRVCSDPSLSSLISSRFKFPKFMRFKVWTIQVHSKVIHEIWADVILYIKHTYFIINDARNILFAFFLTLLSKSFTWAQPKFLWRQVLCQIIRPKTNCSSIKFTLNSNNLKNIYWLVLEKK